MSEMADRRTNWLGWVSLVISIISLAVSSGVAVMGLLWGFALGGTQALTNAVTLCVDYRSEVLTLVDRGLSQEQIEHLLSLEDYNEWSTLSGRLDSTGLQLREANCGSIQEILQQVR